MYCDFSMQNDLLKEALRKNDPASSTPRVGLESGGDEGRQHGAGVCQWQVKIPQFGVPVVGGFIDWQLHF